jgi:hypothetical protein
MSLSDKYIKTIEEIKEKFSIGAFGDKSFPDAAFIVEKDAEKDNSGKTLQKFRHLPHHNKNVKSPTENTSVDLPHLRNALARVNQVKPIKEDKSGYVSRARSHLERHAKILLKTSKGSENFKEIEAICAEFNININDENESLANIKIMKNGTEDAPYCVMQDGKRVKCYKMMKDAKNHMDNMMKG